MVTKNLNNYYSKDLGGSEELVHGWPGNRRDDPLAFSEADQFPFHKTSLHHLHASFPPFLPCQTRLHSVVWAAVPLLEHKRGETIVG